MKVELYLCHYCGNLYQWAIRHAALEANLELTIAAKSISLFEKLKRSRHMINMLLYENGEILTLVSITVTLGKLLLRR